MYCDSHDILLHHQPSAVHLSDSISGYHQCVCEDTTAQGSPIGRAGGVFVAILATESGTR